MLRFGVGPGAKHSGPCECDNDKQDGAGYCRFARKLLSGDKKNQQDATVDVGLIEISSLGFPAQLSGQFCNK